MSAAASATVAASRQPRCLFFVFDAGTGVGHLRRMASIARQFQKNCSCLIVTGHRAVTHWFVSEECEYIRLPSWDSLLPSKARYWGRKPFVVLNQQEAVELRKTMLRGIVEAFAPDVIFVDHLPLGAFEELEEVIRDTPALKYLVTRGVLNETENLRQLILGGKANRYLKSHYHKVLVAMDRRVFDFVKQYNISPDIGSKTLHTGYVTQRIPASIIRRTRKERSVEKGCAWVVASAGGGQLGEALVAHCLALAKLHRKVSFDIVIGPRSSYLWPAKNRSFVVRGNVILHKEASHLPYLHASADVVISSGGYNSILEALQGDAKILCIPSRKSEADEQYHHAQCLRRFVDLDVSTDLSDLPGMFERSIAEFPRARQADQRAALDYRGAVNIARIALEDLKAASSERETRLARIGR